MVSSVKTKTRKRNVANNPFFQCPDQDLPKLTALGFNRHSKLE